MKKKMIGAIISLISVASLAIYNYPSFAEDNVDDLKKQIESLQKRVDELESNKGQTADNDPWSFFNQRGPNQWDPFAEMQRMQEEMDRMFQSSFTSVSPWGRGMFSSNLGFEYDFDMKETKDGYEITFDMAGLDKNKVDVNIDEHSITVKGERSVENREENDNSMFQSRSFGSFLKTIPIPEDADTTRVQTDKQGDNLIIRLPKKTT